MICERTQLITLDRQDYESVWHKMQSFTANRTTETADEIWITEHFPVYTLGLNGKLEHLLQQTNIPVVKSDRGGQITYHGPGQLIIYVLINLKRLNFGARQIVNLLESAIVTSLSQYGIKAETNKNAPGVYVDKKKIASLGLRIKQGYCYHGLSLNNQMDMAPFFNINPCGYPGLEMTQLSEQNIFIDNQELAVPVVHHILKAIEK